MIGACGTVKAGRKNMPLELHPARYALTKGDDPVFMRSGDLLTCAWHDTKRVQFLSTIDSNNTVDKRIRQRGADGGHREVEKPVMAEVYNQSMGGVDLLDQKLGTFAYPHKSAKWYNVVYHRLREVAPINAYIVYCANTTDGTVMSQKVFREKIISGLVEDWVNPSIRRGRPSISERSARLIQRHFVSQYDNKKYRPDCIVCSSRTLPRWQRHQTNYKCKQCDLPMCPVPCHEIYHTHKNFRQEAARQVHNLV